MKRSAPLGLALSLLALVSARAGADEGLWPFDNVPRQQIAERYGVTVDAAFLDRLRLASVRFASGGSGAFVSPRGLVLTNHHIGADCIHSLGDTARDYIRDGFLAADGKQELRCPNVELQRLEHIEDVTAQFRALEETQPPLDEIAALHAQKAKQAQLEKACMDQQPQKARAHTRCEVVALYHGALHHLYRYHRYTDVRLVFAPEFQIAFFGGDPDNFEYPRYDLDVAIFRAYEDGRPIVAKHWLRLAPGGAKDGEPVFVTGNPWMTERMITVAQLEFLRDQFYPSVLRDLRRLRTVLDEFGKRGDDEQRQAEVIRFSVDNTYKAMAAEHVGMLDEKLLGKRRAAEATLRTKLKADHRHEQEYGDLFDRIAKAENAYAGVMLRLVNVEGRHGDPLNSKLFWFAKQLVRGSNELGRPSSERLREFRDTNLPQLEHSLFAPTPIAKPLEEVLIASALERMVGELGRDDALVVEVLGGKSIAERAHEVVYKTAVDTVPFRKQLWRNRAAVAASTDPMIALVRLFEREARPLRQRIEDEIEAPLVREIARLGRARYAVEGAASYPDATNTLRLSFGKVAGYVERGRDIAWTTTFGGLCQRSDEAHGKPPWNLPPRWEKRRARLPPLVPLDFVTTADIAGGNSGSPVVNRQGELVGVVFDGNVQSLPNSFQYDDVQARAVNVQSSAILEALRTVYDANALVAELGSKPGQR